MLSIKPVVLMQRLRFVEKIKMSIDFTGISRSNRAIAQHDGFNGIFLNENFCMSTF